MKLSLQPFVERINLVLEQEGMSPLPDLFKHMALAIFRKGPRTVDKFLDSMEAAFAFLVRYGHITPNSNINNMTLTSTGANLEKNHDNEDVSKSKTFDGGLAVVRQRD